VGLVSGSESGLPGNFKSRIEVPVEATAPIPAGPIPLVVSIRSAGLTNGSHSRPRNTSSWNC
jgi:hypothetical protein